MSGRAASAFAAASARNVSAAPRRPRHVEVAGVGSDGAGQLDRTTDVAGGDDRPGQSKPALGDIGARA